MVLKIQSHKLNSDKSVGKIDGNGSWQNGHAENNAMFVTRGQLYTPMRTNHDLGFDELGCIRGKIDCLDRRDSTEGLGGVGRMKDELG